MLLVSFVMSLDTRKLAQTQPDIATYCDRIQDHRAPLGSRHTQMISLDDLTRTNGVRRNLEVSLEDLQNVLLGCARGTLSLRTKRRATSITRDGIWQHKFQIDNSLTGDLEVDIVIPVSRQSRGKVICTLNCGFDDTPELITLHEMMPFAYDEPLGGGYSLKLSLEGFPAVLRAVHKILLIESLAPWTIAHAIAKGQICRTHDEAGCAEDTVADLPLGVIGGSRSAIVFRDGWTVQLI